MCDIDIAKLKIIIDKWKNPNMIGDKNIEILADETLQVINNEPIIKEICESFLYAISIKAMSDQKFQKL